MKVVGIDPGLSGAIAILKDKKVLGFLICLLWQKEKKIKDN